MQVNKMLSSSNMKTKIALRVLPIALCFGWVALLFMPYPYSGIVNPGCLPGPFIFAIVTFFIGGVFIGSLKDILSKVAFFIVLGIWISMIATMPMLLEFAIRGPFRSASGFLIVLSVLGILYASAHVYVRIVVFVLYMSLINSLFSYSIFSCGLLSYKIIFFALYFHFGTVMLNFFQKLKIKGWTDRASTVPAVVLTVCVISLSMICFLAMSGFGMARNESLLLALTFALMVLIAILGFFTARFAPVWMKNWHVKCKGEL